MSRFRSRRPAEDPASPAPVPAPGLEWFVEKYDGAVAQLLDFCAAGSVALTDAEIADLGCGEGSMTLGLHRRVRPRRLIGFDLKPVDVDALLAHSVGIGQAAELPPGLEFQRSEPRSIPAADASFDFVYSWSAFEHVSDPVTVLGEIHRILRPNGHFFLQLWPFYASAKGSHLWQWFDEDFHHLGHPEEEIVAAVRADERQPREWAEYMLDEFRHLNRLTVPELQRAMLASGFDVLRVEFISWPTMLSPTLARYDWRDLAIGGIKLLARPRT